MPDSFAQFQLRTLFIATAVCGVVLWALYSKPDWVGFSAIYIVYCLMPAMVVSGIVYHRGYRQAFFVGMAPWVAIMAVVAIQPASQRMGFSQVPVEPPLIKFLSGTNAALGQKTSLMLALLMAVASGLVAVAVRRWAISLQQREPYSNKQ